MGGIVQQIIIENTSNTVDFDSQKISKYSKFLRLFALKYLTSLRNKLVKYQRSRFMLSKKLFFKKNIVTMGWSTGTAKFEFNFLDFYKTILPDNPKNILEIGVEFGNSILMWSGIFPESRIFGLDHFTGVYSNGRSYSNVSLFYDDVKRSRGSASSSIQLMKFDQSDPLNYSKFVHMSKDENIEFDLVVDDGSHQWADQLLTLKFFPPLMRVTDSKSILIIEDLHTSLYPTVYKSEEYGLAQSPLEIIQHLQLFIRKENNKSFLLLEKLDLLSVTENLTDVKIFRDNTHFTAALIYQKKS